ncbi:MAG: DedA family protein [Peptococcaceae bacterium]|nr:DedA family protein [Peptococcaceae bacterium]
MGALEHFLTVDVAHFGLLAIFITMTLESACIPIPSEVIMPYAGILVAQGRFPLWQAVVVASLANLVGSVIAYVVGSTGGRPFIRRYGKYIFLSERHLDSADRWFAQRGEITVLLARVLPVFRTFISLPAGITRMNFARFALYSLVGAVPWNLALAYAGVVFADNFGVLQANLHKANLVFYALLGLVVVGLFTRWLRRRRH